MGKFTAVVLLFFLFLFNTNLAQAQGVCYKLVNGKQVWGGVELCRQENCKPEKGRYWVNGVCTFTKPTQQEHVVNVSNVKCSNYPDARLVEVPDTVEDGVTTEHPDVCRCNVTERDVVPALGRDQCKVPEVAAATDNTAACEARGGTMVAKGHGGGETLDCFCKSQNAFMDSSNSKCEEAAQAASEFSIGQCSELVDLEAQAKECNDSAELAKKNCDENKSSDSGLQFSKGLIKMVGDAMIQGKAGTGQTQACAEVSLLGSTAINSMDLFKTTCESNFVGCKASCEKVAQTLKSGSASEACLSRMPLGDDAQRQVIREQIKTRIAAVQKMTTAGTNTCVYEAGKEKDAMTGMLGDLARSSQQAAICQCKKATNGAANCDNIVSPTECLPGGSLYGSQQCQVYGNCSLGSVDYSSVTCQCQRDPTLSTCKTAANTTLSNFAGVADVKPTTPGGADIGAAGSGAGGSDNMDLGSFNQGKPDGSGADATKAAVNAGLSTGGGGGGGGGGVAPSSGGDGAPAVAGEGDGGSSGGLFGQLKSAFGFGGGSSSKAAATGKTTAPGPDLNKWVGKQKRCMASASECSQVNSANKDIFDVVKDRYGKDSILDPYLTVKGPRN